MYNPTANKNIRKVAAASYIITFTFTIFSKTTQSDYPCC